MSRLQRLDRLLEPLGQCLRAQLPVVLSRFQEPEPDIAIVRGSTDDYSERHPRPRDILAILEVADHSLAYDRTTKQRLYAAARIPRYLIVNIPDARFELYEKPLATKGRYARRSDHLPGETLRLALGTAGVIEIDVAAILKR